MHSLEKRWLPLLFLLAACSGSATVGDVPDTQAQAGDFADSAEPVPPLNVFSLITYNVAGLPQGISGSNPEVFVPLIGPLLNSYDIALVQEDFWYHPQLIEEVVHPYQSAPMWEVPELTKMGDGLNRFSIFAFEDFERIGWVMCHGHLDCSNDCLATKGFSYARTELGEGVHVDIYNLHMEAGGCPEDLVSRTAGVAQLLAFIADHSKDVAVIVAGDFNLRETDPTDLPLIEQMLEEGALRDACAELDCGDLRIDKVLFRSSDQVALSVHQWSIPPEFVNPEGVALSDHEPVAVQLSWALIETGH
jgi:hypothetical protein